MSRSTRVLVAVALLATHTVRASDPPSSTATAEASQSSFPVHEDLWDAMYDEPGQQLGMARQLYLSVDLGAAAQRLRKAAANLRITSNQAEDVTKPRLIHSADELELLAHRVENGEVKSVHELDQTSARALHRLSRHHYLMARRLWLQKQAERTGKQLRAAAYNLEHAARMSEKEVQAATQTVVEDVRLISGKLVEGMGYGVDEVGKGFESLGRQVESVGTEIEPSQSISSKAGVLREK
jgi:hypothetical protein